MNAEMARWAYKVLDIAEPYLERETNLLGQEGWKLVTGHCSLRPGAEHWWVCIFRRREQAQRKKGVSSHGD